MKYHQHTAVILSAIALASCASLKQPYEPSSEFNPLDPAGAVTTKKPKADAEESYTSDYRPGTFLSTTSQQTMFYSKFPSSSDQPTKTLSEYIDVKVISSKGSYTKVEVVDTGKVGFIPTVMLGEKRSANEVAVIPGGSIPKPVITTETPYIPEVTPIPSLLPEGVSPEMPELFLPDAPAEVEVPPATVDTMESVIPSAPAPSLDQEIPFTAPEPEYKGIEPPEVINPLLPAE